MSEDQLLTLAKSLVDSGDLAGAEEALAARVKIHPIPLDTLLLLAEIRLRLNRPDEALALLAPYGAHRHCADWVREYCIGERMNAQATAWLNAIPKSGSIDDLIDQAVLLQLSGDARSAAALCRKVLTIQPDNAFGHNHLGRSLFNSGMTAEARQAFESATRLAPAYSQAWHNLGHVLRAQNDLKAAMAAYGKALAIAPYYQSAMLNLALLKMGQGDNTGAIEQLDTLLALNPGHAEGLLNIGICHHILREFDKARMAFEQSIAADPAQPRALRHMGGLLREMQDSWKALDYYRSALSISPGDGDLRAELIATLELLNELDEAEKTVTEGLVLNPKDAGILFESAKLHRRRRDFDGAWQILTSINPQQLPSRLLLSYYYECGTTADRVDRFDEAFTAYEKGNELALTSIRARNTDPTALPRQIERMQKWLGHGAPTVANGPNEDLGADLCFLIGFPRSGTTLLDIMLDGHDRVLSLEEKPTVEHVAFALDRLPGHYPDAMSSLTGSQKAELRLLYRSKIAQYRRPEHTLVIDKMPIRTMHAAFIHRLFPDAKFIFAERHPCDVILSNFMQHYAINEAMIHFARLNTAVVMYDSVMRLWTLTEEKLLSMRVRRVRYESLIADTEGVLRDACAFLDLPWQEGMDRHQDTIAQRAQIKTNSYHQVTEPVYQRSKFRWLNYKSHFEPYMKVLQPHIDRMGY
jgi:tetratricopeptide (TPR) repeat protein